MYTILLSVAVASTVSVAVFSFSLYKTTAYVRKLNRNGSSIHDSRVGDYVDSSQSLSPRKQQAGAFTTSAYYYNQDFSAESLRNAMLSSIIDNKNDFPEILSANYLEDVDEYDFSSDTSAGDPRKNLFYSEQDDFGTYFNF